MTHSIESSPNNPDSGRSHAAIRIDDRHEQEHEQENPRATHSDEPPGRVGRRLRADKISRFVTPEVLPRWGQFQTSEELNPVQNKYNNEAFRFKTLKSFYSYWPSVSAKLRARQIPVENSRTGWRP